MTTVVIFAATLYPTKNLPKIKLLSYDKIGHFLMFAAWTFLFGLVQGIRKNKMPNLWLVFLLGAAFGMFIEMLQVLMPVNRSAEWLDVLADTLGTAAAILVLRPVLNRLLKNTNEQG